MNKQIILYLLLVLSSIFVMNAQTGDRDIDLRFGLGTSNFKNGNNLLLLSEYELNAKLTDYFTIAPSIILNHDSDSDFELPDFFQANLNAFVSPFRNNRRNDFRMGSGLSFYRLNKGASYATRSAFGLNLILENTYMINDRFVIGIKAFIQPYLNKDINYGILLKAGINL